MTRRSSRTTTPKLILESIHRCLPSKESLAGARNSLREKVEKRENKKSTRPGATHVALKAITSSKDSSLFDDLLHAYFIFPRPTEEKNIKELVKLICELSVLCNKSDDASNRWKLFLLVALHRRYHPKSPAFREKQKDCVPKLE